MATPRGRHLTWYNYSSNPERFAAFYLNEFPCLMAINSTSLHFIGLNQNARPGIQETSKCTSENFFSCSFTSSMQ